MSDKTTKTAMILTVKNIQPGEKLFLLCEHGERWLVDSAGNRTRPAETEWVRTPVKPAARALRGE